MPINCPSCGSLTATPKALAKTAFSLAGAFAGAALYAASRRNDISIGKPKGRSITGIADAVFRIATSSATGCITGARLGDEIDLQVLGNYKCGGCGISFSCPQG